MKCGLDPLSAANLEDELAGRLMVMRFARRRGPVARIARETPVADSVAALGDRLPAGELG